MMNGSISQKISVMRDLPEIILNEDYFESIFWKIWELIDFQVAEVVQEFGVCLLGILRNQPQQFFFRFEVIFEEKVRINGQGGRSIISLHSQKQQP